MKDLKKHTYNVATQYGLDPALMFAIIEQESNWNPRAYNRAGGGSGAHGIGQFRDAAMQEFKVENPYDPYQAIEGMARKLKAAEDRGLSGIDIALSYHDGISGVKQARAGNRNRTAASRQYERRIRDRIERYGRMNLMENLD